ncbi:MAG: biotin transporter BioY [Candidatus Omnitrophota bacterium]|nr:MAG: biotin transporter BioY [Candidatus Omnitrophota bacterium]
MVRVWNKLWELYFRKVERLSIAWKLSLSILFSILTGISAQIYIKLPYTPVPVTGQVFVVLLSGILLGKNFGCLSQAFYMTGGVLGIRWFYAGSYGIFKPTFGYIIGFVIASYFIGKSIENRKKTLTGIIFIMLSGIFIIYLSGMLWLSIYLKISLLKSFYLGVLPFIPYDIIKAVVAGIISKSILNSR